jgi:hypothetical protein
MRLVCDVAFFEQAQEIADFPAVLQLPEDVPGVAPHCGNVDEFEQGVVFLFEIFIFPLGRAHEGLSDLHLVLAFFLLVATPFAWALAITFTFASLTDLASGGNLLPTSALLAALDERSGLPGSHDDQRPNEPSTTVSSVSLGPGFSIRLTWIER